MKIKYAKLSKTTRSFHTSSVVLNNKRNEILRNLENMYPDLKGRNKYIYLESDSQSQKMLKQNQIVILNLILKLRNKMIK